MRISNLTIFFRGKTFVCCFFLWNLLPILWKKIEVGYQEEEEEKEVRIHQ